MNICRLLTWQKAALNLQSAVKKGDSVYMPSNVEHGVTALEDGKLVDVFNPMRQDFLK